MSTTQGPYKVIEDWLRQPAPLTPKKFYRVASDWHSVGGEIMYDRQDAERLARSYNSAYAAGQSSKQAELDKAVELLREMRQIAIDLSDYGPTMDRRYALEEARKVGLYLSTLNPQPDAAQ